MQGICRYYAINMPFIFAKLGPFSALLAAMWTVQKMSKDQEITAAQVAGVSLHRLMAPVLIVGVLLSLGLLGDPPGDAPADRGPAPGARVAHARQDGHGLDARPLLVQGLGGEPFFDPELRPDVEDRSRRPLQEPGSLAHARLRRNAL